MKYTVVLYRLNGTAPSIWENVIMEANALRISEGKFGTYILDSVHNLLAKYGATFKTYSTGGTYAEFETDEQRVAFVLRFS